MRVLACGAHPDDVELGAGATLAKHVMAGDEVTIYVLTGGVLSRSGATVADERILREQAEEAAKVLGVNLEIATYPDQGLDTIPKLDLAQSVERIVNLIGPEVVYTHSASDLNHDHRLTYDAVKVACRPAPARSVRALYSFEVPSSTEWGLGFHPKGFVDVSGDPLALKLQALACYKSEMREAPHPRSVAGVVSIAHWRGATVGVEAAEAFELVWERR